MFPDLEFIKTALNAIMYRFRCIQSNVDTVKSNVDTVKSNVDTVKSNVDTVKANVDTVKANVDTIQRNAPDWNEPDSTSHAYIKNKPCYDYIEPSGVIWGSDSARTSAQSALTLVDLVDGWLIEGETYRLTVDGVETTYTCAADANGRGLYIGTGFAVFGGGFFQYYTDATLRAFTDGLWNDGQKVRLEGPLRRYKKLDTSLYEAAAVDSTLTQTGQAADAAAVGNRLSSLSERIANLGGGTGTGAPGQNGVGIRSVEQTTTSTEDGGTNVVTVTKTDGTSSTFQVRNGSKGSPGAGGKSAYQYAKEGGYTGTEAEFAAKLAEEIPDKLPNPNALTFSGAVTGSYDGSAPVSVEIPSGGGAAEREWTMLGEIDVSVAGGGSIELTDLDNFTEFYATWKNVVNESTTASGYALKINDTGIAQSVIMIQKTGTASSYGWVIAKHNGLVWEVQRSSGTISSSNITLSGNNVPYNLLLGVGKAVKFKLEAPALAYQAKSGIITIYGR